MVGVIWTICTILYHYNGTFKYTFNLSKQDVSILRTWLPNEIHSSSSPASPKTQSVREQLILLYYNIASNIVQWNDITLNKEDGEHTL